MKALMTEKDSLEMMMSFYSMLRHRARHRPSSWTSKEILLDL